MGNRNNGRSEARDGAPPAGGEKFSLISDEKLIALYKDLLKWRRIRGAAFSQPGHEASMAGTAIDLGPGDVACSLDVPVYSTISGNGATESLLAGSGYNGSSAPQRKKAFPANGHSSSPFVHAVIGTALANKTARNGKVAVAYCAGDSVHLSEALRIAAVHALPIVFVQQFDSSSPANGKLASRTKNSGEDTPWFPSIAVDSHDVVAVYRVANESISRARLGRGPTLIECRPYPFNDASSNGHRRPAGDSVRNMEHYLRAKGLFDSNLKRETAAELRSR